MDAAAAVADLPEAARSALATFLEEARAAFGPDLRSAVLYGSAAEGRLRASSDINLLLVLDRLEPAAAERLAAPYRAARARARIEAMFLRADELPAAAEAFASKFADMRRRHRVLFGTDPLAALVIPRAAEALRLRQELLNLVLRGRSSLVLDADRDDALARVLAELAGPLRAAAGTLREIEGAPPIGARESLEAEAAREGPEFAAAVAILPAVRAGSLPPAGTAGPSLAALLALAERLRARATAAIRP
jgi:predicted nucleotidyltransferase